MTVIIIVNYAVIHRVHSQQVTIIKSNLPCTLTLKHRRLMSLCCHS